MTGARTSEHRDHGTPWSRPPVLRRLGAITIAMALAATACGGSQPFADVAPDDGPRVTPQVVDVPTPTVPAEPTATAESADPTAAPTEDADTGEADAPADDPATPTPAPTPIPEPAPRPVSIPSDLSVSLTPVLDFSQAIAMAVRPGTGETYLAGKRGRVVQVDLSTTPATIVGDDLLDIGGRLSSGNEQGLLGMTFSPDGNALYLDYTDGAGATVIAEWTMTESGIDLASERIVLTVAQPAANHNAGDIVFGPDGLLYITLGDGGGGGDPFATGQDRGSLLGSILRIAPQGADPYGVPSDNPFVDGGGRSEIWITGVRNPWRISFDSLTGDLWVADVGQQAVEEVDVLYASEGGGRGVNLGWSDVEGSSAFNAANPPTDNYVGPIVEYRHDEGCSITGGYVYRGEAIPELWGSYIFGDYCSGSVWGFASTEADGAIGRFDITSISTNSLASFGQDANGELYILSHADGTVYRIDP